MMKGGFLTGDYKLAVIHLSASSFACYSYAMHVIVEAFEVWSPRRLLLNKWRPGDWSDDFPKKRKKRPMLISNKVKQISDKIAVMILVTKWAVSVLGKQAHEERVNCAWRIQRHLWLEIRHFHDVQRTSTNSSLKVVKYGVNTHMEGNKHLSSLDHGQRQNTRTSFNFCIHSKMATKSCCSPVLVQLTLMKDSRATVNCLYNKGYGKQL